MLDEADKLIEEILNDGTDTGTPEPETPPVEEPAPKDAPPAVDQTKAFSERLKKEKEKMKAELAKELGYESWEKAMSEKAQSALLDSGIDPEKVKPIIKDLLKSDPDYVAAIEYKKDREELEKKLWADNEIKNLNSKFGLGLKSVEDLDENVIKLWNSGLPLDKAYAAEHYAEIEKNLKTKAPNGTEHMKPNVGKGTTPPTSKTLTAEQLKIFKMLNPNASEDEIKKFYNK